MLKVEVGGGGGRIALYYTNYSFSGTLTAYGGTPGGRYGGAGTIYKKPNSQTYADIILNNNDQTSLSDTYLGYTTIESGEYNAITIQNYGRLVILNSSAITYSSLDWSTKGIIVDNGGTFALVSGGGSLTIPATTYLYANTARTFSGLSIAGVLTHSKNVSTEIYKIDLTVNGDTTIESGGSINIASLGYEPVNGPGAGTTGSYSGGGGHGGRGSDGSYGRLGGSAYGSLGAPVTIGSGGGNGTDPGGIGGGAVKIVTSGTITIGGSISANGGNYQGGSYDPGGGAGGSIYLITGSLAGSSAVSANGGAGDAAGGGGGGGRIAIYYSGSNTYGGSVTVTKGTGGAGNGQDGTIVLKATSGEIISTPFNTGDPDTLIYDLSWTEDISGEGTDIKLQLRTAPNNIGAPGTWTEWMGPSGIDTYYTDPTGTSENIYSTHSDAGSDQWVQYKVVFSAASGNEYIPTVSDITLTYVVNTAPTVTITNTPALNSTGEYTITYTISDPEENSAATYLAADIGITTGSEYTKNSTSDLTVSDGSYFPSAGTILLDNEMISYTTRSGNVLSGITRGANSTTDVTHITGSSVWLVASGVAGDIGASVNFTGTKSVTWTPATDLTSLETTTAKVKIVANDGNLANQVASDTVNNVTLDTKAPISTDIFLNNRTNQLTLTATDGNAIFYKASNSSDLSGDGINANSGSWVALSSPVDWTMALDPATAYVRYKDAYGNETGTISTTGPAKLTTFLIQDASNPDTSEWRLFISWPVVSEPGNGFAYYQLYRSTDNITFTPYAQVNNRSENYYVDTGLDSATTYYYKGTVVDNHGNESDYNDIASAGSASKSGVGLTPDGSGGGDFTAPAISAITASDLSPTSAVITWTTDELANSTIGYSTDTGYATEFGSITMTTSHSVTLSNLTPGTKYYFRVISSDAVNNKSTAEDSSTHFFSTLADTTGPTISDVKSVVGETSAGISWSTTEAADSLVEYSTDDSFSESTSSASLVLGHALTLSGLTNNTTYNYRVKSADSYDNLSTSPEYAFTTTSVTVAADTTAPSISNVGVSEILATSAKVSWNTNENADGKVEYGETSSYERGIAEGNHNYTTAKSVTLIGLSPETTYHYRVIAVDAAGNTNSSGDATFKTASQPTLDDLSSSGASSGSNAPSITSEGPTITNITGTSATVTWNTNKKSTSQVYYKVKNSLDAPSGGGDTSYLASHLVVLSGLTPATTYEYQVKSVDVNGNYVTSAKYEFTTTLPGVASVRVTKKSASSATIEWATTTPTTTVVEYIDTITRVSKRYSNSSQVTSHVAELVSLTPSTPYVFEVLVSDEAGNLARSDQYSFVTDIDIEGPVISGVNNRSTIVAGQNKVQTVITWTTNEPTTSQVEYSLGTGVGDYDQSTQLNEDFVNTHIMVIANLKPGSVYRYRVISQDRAENRAESEPYVLLTPIKEVSALDLIISNLEGAFGWLNNIRR